MIADMMASTDRAKARRAAEAMLKMVKLDIAALKAAFDGAERYWPSCCRYASELRLHRLHRARAVRQLALGADAGLGERLAELGREEQRVVAEAAGAARRVEDRRPRTRRRR